MNPDLEHHDWRSYAACAAAPDPNVFHPVKWGSKARREAAAAYCDPCPVRAQCLALAKETNSEGMFAGTSHRERGFRATPGGGLPTVTQQFNARRDREIRELRDAGISHSEIAERVNVNERTVYRVLKAAA